MAVVGYKRRIWDSHVNIRMTPFEAGKSIASNDVYTAG
jgi:hypothetical protein